MKTFIKRDLPNDEYQAAIGANNPSASNVFATIADLASAGGIQHAIASGTNTYTATIPGITAYTDGDAYLIRFTNGSDADSTININSLGAIPLVKKAAIQVTGGDIVAGQEMLIIYDGTNFQCLETTSNQLFAYVTNDDSVTITAGQPVYAFGAAGNRMSVKLANNVGDATSAQTVGLVFSSSIAPNQRGFVITQGVIDGLDTSMYSAGDQLYLGATAGTLTNVKPYAPNHLVYIGIVERANAGNGQIYVKPQNGYELDELHDVDLITAPPLDGQVLGYDSLTNLWKPLNIPGATSSGTQLLTGQASWSGTGMLFNVSTLTYTIDGDYYTSAPQDVTLAVGDPSNPRFDAIVVDAAGVVSVITGTPAANPLVPSVPGTQVLVQYVLVGAGQVTPSITNEFVYRQGSSPDWTAAVINSNPLPPLGPPLISAIYNSTTPAPIEGAECTLVNAPSYTTTRILQWTKPSGNISRAAFPFLSFRVQLLAGSVGRNILVRLYNGTTYIGAAWASNYGLSASTVGSWQLVNIPLSAFGNPTITTATRIQFLFNGSVVGTTQFAFDDIKFQSGYGPQANTATIDILDSGTVIGATAKLNFIDGTNTTAVVTQDIPNNKIDVKIDASAITSLNGLTAPSQSFATSATGVDFSITTSGTLHFFNLPLATAVNTGKLSNVDWNTFNNKIGGSGTVNYLAKFSPTGSAIANSLFRDNGTSAAINAAPSIFAMLNIFTNTLNRTIQAQNSGNNGTGIYSQVDTGTGSMFAIFGFAASTAATENIALSGQALNGVNNYCFQGQDGTQGIGKFLKSVTADGKANWADIFNQTIENQGSPLAQRSNINFTGAGVTTTDAGGKTVVTINGGGAGGTIRTAQIGITDVSGPGGIFILGQALIYAVQPTGGAAVYNSRWQLTIPADYTGGGVVTLRVYRPGTSPTTSLTVYINNIASNIVGATFVPATSANWSVFTFNLTTAAVAGDTLTILAALTASGGQDFYFRDVYFNYQS